MVLGRYEDAETEFVTLGDDAAGLLPLPDQPGEGLPGARASCKRGTGHPREAARPGGRHRTGDARRSRDHRDLPACRPARATWTRPRARFVDRYPDEDDAPIYRAMRLAYLGRMRRGPRRHGLEPGRLARGAAVHASIPTRRARASRARPMQFDGIAADLARRPRRAPPKPGRAALRILQPGVGRTTSCSTCDYRLAAALRASGRPREALAQIDPVLAVNPRLPEALLLKVRCHLRTGRDRGRAAGPDAAGTGTGQGRRRPADPAPRRPSCAASSAQRAVRCRLSRRRRP